MSGAPAFPLDAARTIVERALDEDLGTLGDRTTRALIAPGTIANGVVAAREPIVAAGVPLAAIVMEGMARRGGGPVDVTALATEGAPVAAGGAILRLVGDAWSVLSGERVLLNLLARLSGIATVTARCVDEVRGTKATIADTRKTTPGLRPLEKYAVACGGGENHRFTLDELVLVKDNHKQLVGGLAAVVAGLARAQLDPREVEIEVDGLDEFDVALEAEPGFILLDNFDVAMVREAARRRGTAATRLEASGGLRPGGLRAYAEAGVDRLSLGFLTHGVRSVDIGLDLE